MSTPKELAIVCLCQQLSAKELSMDPEPGQMLQPFLAHQRTVRNMIFKGGNFRGLDLAGLRADGINLEDADLRESCLH
jgi:hypothetical protein